MRVVWAALAILSAASACGRLGFDDVERVAAVDAPPACPSGTTPITAGSSFCIEASQRGTATWTSAKADCTSGGRRLCTDAEWLTACVDATGLSNMIDDWEWLADESNGVALKRGSSACSSMSSHEIFIDPYGYRCCVATQ